MKTKVIINGQTVKTDYDTDPRLVYKYEIEEELDDIIPVAEIECSRKINDLIDLRQNMTVEIFQGDTPKRIFYGHIVDITTGTGSTKIIANMETINLLRKKVNKLYRYYK